MTFLRLGNKQQDVLEVTKRHPL